MTRNQTKGNPMVDQNETDETDEAAAARDLSDLERRAMDGHSVTPTELAEARERVTLAGLFARGRAQRAAADAEKARHSKRVAAKTAAAQTAAEAPDIAAAERDILAAFGALLATIDKHNTVVRDVRKVFDEAGLPRPASWGQLDPMDVPGLDKHNYAWVAMGDELSYVNVDGRILKVLDRKAEILNALRTVVRENNLGRDIEIKQ